jgi:hypothetical protein
LLVHIRQHGGCAGLTRRSKPVFGPVPAASDLNQSLLCQPFQRGVGISGAGSSVSLETASSRLTGARRQRPGFRIRLSVIAIQLPVIAILLPVIGIPLPMIAIRL